MITLTPAGKIVMDLFEGFVAGCTGREGGQDLGRGWWPTGVAGSGECHCCRSKWNKTIWVVDGTDVKQLSPDGQVLRQLSTKAGDPAPVQIAASPVADVIYLLEQSDKLQRVRALVLQSNADASPQPSPAASPPGDAPPKTSVWKVAFTKSITFSDKIEQVRDLLKTSGGKAFVPQDKIALKLQPNPLENDKAGTLDATIGFDAKGSFIKTLDGLPLCGVSETPNLKWAAIGLEGDGKTVIIFQSDGAVIEQFKVTKLGMSAFDAGDFDFDCEVEVSATRLRRETVTIPATGFHGVKHRLL